MVEPWTFQTRVMTLLGLIAIVLLFVIFFKADDRMKNEYIKWIVLSIPLAVVYIVIVEIGTRWTV